MKAHDRSLSWKNSFWTKLVIKASSWTSAFGQSVDRPIVFLFVGHFIFFMILLVYGFFMPLHISFSHPNFEGFWLGVNNYFRLINPLRGIDYSFKGGLIIIDLAMRIWSSYMIYNIIRATRRFIR